MKYALFPALLVLPALAETTPLVTPPAKEHPITLDLSFVANFATRDITKETDFSVPTIGADLTANYALTPTHSVNLRLGYTTGETDETTIVDDAVYYQVNGSINTMYFMPGYRYTHKLFRSFDWFAGANVGLAYVTAKDEEFVQGSKAFNVRDSSLGLAYSAELGIVYHVRPSLSIFAAYQFSGTTAKPKLKTTYEGKDYSITVNRQTYHGFRMGVSCHF